MSTQKQTVKPLFEVTAVDSYPAGDAIYIRDKEIQDIDPEDVFIKKAANELSENPKEIDLFNSYDGAALDVPGTELDDADVEIGEEDEENNYFSIGEETEMELEDDHYD